MGELLKSRFNYSSHNQKQTRAISPLLVFFNRFALSLNKSRAGGDRGNSWGLKDESVPSVFLFTSQFKQIWYFSIASEH